MKVFWDFYNRNFLWLELAVCAAISFVFAIYAEFLYGRASLTGFLHGTRQAAYSALVSVNVSLLGFVLTAVSIILVFGQAPQFDLLRRSGQYPAVFRIFFQAVYWLALAALWAFIGLLTDTDCSPTVFITYGMLFFALVVVARICRCVWILRHVAAIATHAPPPPPSAASPHPA